VFEIKQQRPFLLNKINWERKIKLSEMKNGKRRRWLLRSEKRSGPFISLFKHE